jgi:DNA-binding NarL/FixJ family response regulator
LADDHSIVRAGLRRIVEESGDMEVIAEASEGREAIQLVHESQPDVAVVDISMPGLDGLEVVTQLQSNYSKLPILILTMHEEGQYVVRAIQAGAMGYITKQSAPEQLVNAIRKVHNGQRYLTDEAAEALALRIAKGANGQSPLDSLSVRELQVLRRLAMGQTNRDIATAYHISIKTVDTYR